MLRCIYKEPEGVCLLTNGICEGDKEKFCTWYIDGCCKLSENICTCASGCSSFINKTAVHEHIYIGINYKAYCYDPEYKKYSCIGGVEFGSCIEDCLLRARIKEYEICREFDMKLKKITLVSVIYNIFGSDYIPYD